MNSTPDVHLFVLNTLADWEIGHAVAHINRPAPGVEARYKVRTVGSTLDRVRTLGGVEILPGMTLDALDPSESAMLILPGADLWMGEDTHAALEKARAFVDAGVPVAAICGATFGLARAGLLDDRPHTSNDPGFLASSGYGGAALYRNQPAVDGVGVITASAMASLEFARAILARLAVFPDAALDAWYGLYKTGEAEYYHAFTNALGIGPEA